MDNVSDNLDIEFKDDSQKLLQGVYGKVVMGNILALRPKRDSLNKEWEGQS